MASLVLAPAEIALHFHFVAETAYPVVRRDVGVVAHWSSFRLN